MDDLIVLGHHITFNVNGIFSYVFKVDHCGKEYCALVKTKDKTDWKNISIHNYRDITLSEGISNLLRNFIDLTDYQSIYCATTNLKILKNDSFTHFPNGLKIKKGEYVINTESKACPEWVEIEVPERYITTINTNNGVTYITKLKDGVQLVDIH